MNVCASRDWNHSIPARSLYTILIELPHVNYSVQFFIYLHVDSTAQKHEKRVTQNKYADAQKPKTKQGNLCHLDSDDNDDENNNNKIANSYQTLR
jgi:hypothetical protein